MSPSERLIAELAEQDPADATRWAERFVAEAVRIVEEREGKRERRAEKSKPRREAESAEERRALAHRRKVYAKVDRRSRGLCECPGCSSRGREHDHFFGRGKAPETPATIWRLCLPHHSAKTLNQPSRLAWLQAYRQHLTIHRIVDDAGVYQRVAGAIALEEAQHRAPDGEAAWVPCSCGEVWCRIHHSHAFGCPCPSLEEWKRNPYLYRE